MTTESPTHWLLAEIERWKDHATWNDHLTGPEIRRVENYRGRFGDADDLAAHQGAHEFRHGDPLDHPAPIVYRYYRSEQENKNIVTVFIQGRKLSEYEGSEFVQNLPIYERKAES